MEEVISGIIPKNPSKILMLKLMSFLLVLTFSAKSFSQSCVGSLLLDKKTSYVDRLDEDGRLLVGFGARTGGMVLGLAVASSALPVFLIAAGFASSVILAVKELQKFTTNQSSA